MGGSASFHCDHALGLHDVAAAPLRQIGASHHGRPGCCSGADLTKATLVKWLVLRRHSFYRSFRVHLSQQVRPTFAGTSFDSADSLFSHSFGRKFFLHLELIYQLVQIVFAWFSLGNFYIAFFVLTASLETSLKWTKYINIPLNYIYLGLLIMCFVLALGNRPAG